MSECTDPPVGALLIPYALETLTEDEATTFEQHLLQCPACQLELESAAPSLERLAQLRQLFVQRAHVEQEDFESQFARLTREHLAVSHEQPSGWRERIWLFLWGRRWALGSVAAVAFAIFVGIEYAPRFETTRLPAGAASPMKVQPASPTSRSIVESPEMLYKLGSEHVTRPESTAMRAPQPAPSQPTPLASSIAVPVPVKEETAAPPPNEQRLTPSQHSMVGMADKAAGEALPMPETQIQTEALAYALPGADMSRLVSADSLNRLADEVLGAFDPAEYHYSEFASGVRRRLEDYETARIPSRESAKAQADASDADSLLAQRQYLKAKIWYQRELVRDSGNVGLKVMLGVSFLATGDYGRAKGTLTSAYASLPAGSSRNEAGLLLARADILSGKLGEARTVLEQIKAQTEEAKSQALAARALARLDSFTAQTKSEPAPK